MIRTYFLNYTATTEINHLSHTHALPINARAAGRAAGGPVHRQIPWVPRRAEVRVGAERAHRELHGVRSEEHTSELQSRLHIVCRLLLEKKNTYERYST